jgi:hypothetical protein
VNRRIARGDLTVAQVMILDKYLAHHGFPPSVPHAVPDLVAYVCLGCGCIGVAGDNLSRDSHVENYDFACCDTTVTFHSDDRVLVDITRLVPVRVIVNGIEHNLLIRGEVN